MRLRATLSSTQPPIECATFPEGRCYNAVPLNKFKPYHDRHKNETRLVTCARSEGSAVSVNECAVYFKTPVSEETVVMVYDKYMENVSVIF